jgi:hypothetical protein
MSYPTEAEARLALESVRSGRQQVVDEIGMPWWYWCGLAACWVVLGLLSNFDARSPVHLGDRLCRGFGRTRRSARDDGDPPRRHSSQPR